MGFSIDPGKAFAAIKRVPGKAADVAKDVLEVAKEAPEAAVEITKDSLKLAKYVAHHPPDLDQMRRMGKAIREAVVSGEQVVIEGKMPAYAPLDPVALAEARKRGEGRTIKQPYIVSSQSATRLHEPVNLVVKGSKEDLVRALESQGWLKAPNRSAKNYLRMAAKVLFGTERDTNGPVSAMHLDGREEAMAFNKNDDYNAGRDHLRVWHTGTDPKTGKDIWQIAGTRDLVATVTVPHPTWDGLLPDFEAPRFGHRIDGRIDKERDMIMQDMLASGLVKDWAAVDGERKGAPEVRREDGRVIIRDGKYDTDGKVYEVEL